MDKIYETPKSNLENVPEILPEVQALRDMYASQRVVLSTIIASAATTFFVLLLSFSTVGTPILVLLLPGVISGVIVKYVGNLIEVKLRLYGCFFVGAITAGLIYNGSLGLPITLGLANAGIFLALSRRRLSIDEEKILSRESVGKISRY